MFFTHYAVESEPGSPQRPLTFLWNGGPGANSVLVVTDGHLVAAGHVMHAKRSLDEAGLASHLFEDAHENPTTRDIDMCVAFARDRSVDAIIGIGGGSRADWKPGGYFFNANLLRR